MLQTTVEKQTEFSPFIWEPEPEEEWPDEEDEDEDEDGDGDEVEEEDISIRDIYSGEGGTEGKEGNKEREGIITGRKVV